ncbi:hypothetical protein KW797_00585 [Candidatus Parcubacteria bacterium]|nr:hypothetical protein [Candidatus Parcubacteria bacterium]
MEIVVYSAIVAAMSVLVVRAILSLTKVSAEIKSYTDLSRAGAVAMERLTKEIRFASSVDFPGSAFSDGRLMLNTTDAAGAPKKVEFRLGGGSIDVTDGGIAKGTLTGSSTEVSSLIFVFSTTTRGGLIKVNLVLSDLRTPPRIERFYGSAVMRGAYASVE